MMRQIALMMAFWASLAHADLDDPVKVFARWKSAARGTVEISIGFDIEEKGFRVYRDSLKIAGDRPVLENPIPKGEVKVDKFTKGRKEVFTTRTEWNVKLAGKPDENISQVELSITYRACNDHFCLFPKTKKLVLKEDDAVVKASFLGNLGDFWLLLTASSSDRVKHIAGERVWLAILLCFFAGVLASVTPCVYPMIPITLNIFSHSSRRPRGHKGDHFDHRAFALAALYVTGMCVTYSIIGVLTGLTGSLFGQVLRSSLVLGGLTTLFFLLALSELGVIPVRLPRVLERLGNGENPLGIFVMGLLSGVVICPCVGPIVAGVLAFVFETSSAWLGLLYFVSFSLGLGMLFLFVGGFSGTLARLPRFAPWMVRINRALALVLLVVAGYYGALLMKNLGFRGPASLTGGVVWMTDEAAAVKLAGETGMPLLIDFTAEWCEECHEIDAQVFADERVASELRAFVTLRLDVTDSGAASSRLLAKYRILSLPAMVFLSPDGEILDSPRISGLVPVDEFLAALKLSKPNAFSRLK